MIDPILVAFGLYYAWLYYTTAVRLGDELRAEFPEAVAGAEFTCLLRPDC